MIQPSVIIKTHNDLFLRVMDICEIILSTISGHIHYDVTKALM